MSPWYDRRVWGLLGFGLMTAWFCLMNGPLATVVLMGAAAVHELGHLAVLRLLGGRTGSFTLSPFGAVIRTAGVGLTYPRELLAVLAGPAVNLLCAALLAAVPARPDWAVTAAGASAALGLFNLLPAAPLDGWRMLQLLLCWTAGPDRGTCWAATIGAAGALLLAGSLLWMMAASGGNLWLLPAVLGTGIGGIRSALRS